MTTELIPQELPIVASQDRPLTVQEVSQQSLVIHRILTEVMVEGIHYGKIPGTDKPTLLQPGAEKICATFRLAPKYDVEDLSEPHNNLFRYRVKCSIYTIRDGYFVGSAVGEASTAEEKYQWQRAVCQEQWDEADPTQRRKKWKEDGTHILQIQRNGADLANTCLKMATKRALISATRCSTACSDLLDVDLDEEAVADLVKEQAKEQTKDQAPAQKPKAKTPPAPRVPYGNYKDKHIDDPAVPLAELQYLANSTEKGLDDPKRAKFKAQNQAFLVALDTEIARRTNTAAPGQAQGGQPKESTRGPMPDATWTEFEALAMEKYSAAVQAVLASVGLVDLAQVKPEERWTCFDKINAEVGAQH